MAEYSHQGLFEHFPTKVRGKDFPTDVRGKDFPKQVRGKDFPMDVRRNCILSIILRSGYSRVQEVRSPQPQLQP